MPDYTVASATRVLTDFRRYVKRDLGPLVTRVKRTGRGFLTIPREAFAHIDFLGALYCGYDGTADRNGRRWIATTRKALAFTAEVLGEVDVVYRVRARILYEMFRHGAVHLSRPNLLRRPDRATIEFVSYVGERSNAPILYDRRPRRVSHLHPLLIGSGRSILPLSVNVLYDDLLVGIDEYSGALRRGASRGGVPLLQNFNSTMNALMEPDPTNETW